MISFTGKRSVRNSIPVFEGSRTSNKVQSNKFTSVYGMSASLEVLCDAFPTKPAVAHSHSGKETRAAVYLSPLQRTTSSKHLNTLFLGSYRSPQQFAHNNASLFYPYFLSTSPPTTPPPKSQSSCQTQTPDTLPVSLLRGHLHINSRDPDTMKLAIIISLAAATGFATALPFESRQLSSQGICLIECAAIYESCVQVRLQLSRIRPSKFGNS